MNISERAFRTLLDKHPLLCASGLSDPGVCETPGLDFDAERHRLESAYDEFSLCCDWLLECTPLKHVSFVSPVSNALVLRVGEYFGSAVSHGALVAAVLYLRIPHHHLPDSPNLKVGISLRSPTLVED